MTFRGHIVYLRPEWHDLCPSGARVQMMLRGTQIKYIIINVTLSSNLIGLKDTYFLRLIGAVLCYMWYDIELFIAINACLFGYSNTDKGQ